MTKKKLVPYADADGIDFTDIAVELGVTRQRAQQIYLTALKKAMKVAAERGIKLEDLFND